MQWANEFNAVLTTRGEDLCAIGYEGFLRSGSKGAVAVRFWFFADVSVCICAVNAIRSTVKKLT